MAEDRWGEEQFQDATRAIARRLVRALRQRITSTDMLLHLMILLVVPLLLAGLTWFSNAAPLLPFVIYPPLASGTYTLFADPESVYAEPKRFVGGMTLGALSGWVAIRLTSTFWYTGPPGEMEVHAGATAFAIALTVISTWVLDLEVPVAFSAALLALVAGTDLSYVLAIAISSSMVAGLFLVWRDRIYEQRGEFLFRTATSDDRVLIPVRDIPADEETALFGAHLAAAHEAGRVVLYRASPREEIPAASLDESAENPESVAREEGGEREKEAEDGEGPWTPTPDIAAVDRARTAIEETVDVPVEVAVETGDPADPERTLAAARALECDLIVAGQEGAIADRSDYLAGIFSDDIDAIAFHPSEEVTSWSRVLVLVRGPGKTARAMIDFATRIATSPERVSVAHTIDGSERRREAETMLAELVDSYDSDLETRVARGPVGRFLERNSAHYDVVFVGSSTDRSVASRILSPPTFRNLTEVEADIALVHVS
ncbi:MAG: HPP family protein [Halodesulfurarchaeum sp.]